MFYSCPVNSELASGSYILCYWYCSVLSASTFFKLISFLGSGSGQTPFIVYPNDADGIPKILRPVFGMASYKFKGSMWTQNGVSEFQHANSLIQAAENWLRLLQVNHPDFQFFASHGMYLW
ncbi:hypothetical protein CRYUN_Cryun13aG0061200 [Craigia yunnanensis]